MPRKICQLIADLKQAGFVDCGGIGSYRNFTQESGTHVTISGQESANAKVYQVRQALEAIGNQTKKKK